METNIIAKLQEKRESVLGNAFRRVGRHVAYSDVSLACGFDVDVVKARCEYAYKFKVRALVHYFCSYAAFIGKNRITGGYSG